MLVNKNYRDAYLSGLDRKEETVVLGSAESGTAIIYKALAEDFKEKALCLAGSIASADEVKTENTEVWTLSELVGKGYDEDAKQMLRWALKGKEIVLAYAIEKMQFEALRFLISTIDEVNINYGRQIKIAFFIDPDKAKSCAMLKYVKAFVHRTLREIRLPEKELRTDSENKSIA